MSESGAGYTVSIRKNATGEVRSFWEPYRWEAGSQYLWEDGNYGCDCNRALFYERAGDADPDLDDVECGEGAFTITAITLRDGRIVYSEIMDTAPRT